MQPRPASAGRAPASPRSPVRTDWLARHAIYTPEKAAVVWAPTGRACSFAHLDAQATRLADALRATYGVQKGDRLAVLAENSLEHVLLLFAAQKAGFVLVPLNHRLTAPELAYLVADSAPAVCFVAEDYAPVLDDVLADSAPAAEAQRPPVVVPLAEVEALAREGRDHALDVPVGLDDALMILYTSGTTGRPKGAIITHGMIVWNAVNTALRLDLTSNDRSFNAAPLYHTGGWNVLLTPFLHYGATTFLLPGFDADEALRLCDDERLTVFWGVPTMLRRMADANAFADVTLETVRYAIVGGEPMPEGLIRTWQAKGVPIRQGFGMTEVGVNCFSLPEEDALRKIGSIGLPNFYIETRVVDEIGLDVARGETGELWMRGPVVTPGYWRNPEATAEAIDPDGWFATGDVVRQDEDGYFYVVGRTSDLFISGGENVYPAEIEAVLHEHPAVAEAAVVGVPDEAWGEAGAAFVVLAEEAPALDAEAVRAYCRTRLAAYKVPRDVHILDDPLPRGHSGKIDKQALADCV